MPDFWIDANIYMMARRGILAFDIAPRFWNHLDHFARAGRIASPIEVCVELNNHFDSRDILIRWLRVRVNSHFAEADNFAQDYFTQIADHVIGRYSRAHADKFLTGADPWLIAHAIASGGRIVTNERPTREPGPNRNTGLIDTKVQIPNIGNHFGIASVPMITMLRDLGINDL